MQIISKEKEKMKEKKDSACKFWDTCNITKNFKN